MNFLGHTTSWSDYDIAFKAVDTFSKISGSSAATKFDAHVKLQFLQCSIAVLRVLRLRAIASQVSP